MSYLQNRIARIVRSWPLAICFIGLIVLAISQAAYASSPTVTINQAAGQADPTNTSPINFTAVFNQSVSDFVSGDVTVSGTALATTATVTGSGTTYNVAVTGMTRGGTVIVNIPAGVAHNASSEANVASTSSDKQVTYDSTRPTVTINQAAGQTDPSNASTINFSVVFSETVTGFATGDVTLSGTADATTATVTGSGRMYNVAVTGMAQSGTVIATIAADVAQDASGNTSVASTSSDNSISYDNIPPTVTIDQTTEQSDPTANSIIDYTVVFSEPVTDFATGDITLSGTAGAVTAVVTGSGTDYSVAVSGMSDVGTVIADIAAGVAHDAAGNGNIASTSTDNEVIYDYNSSAQGDWRMFGRDLQHTGASPYTGPTEPILKWRFPTGDYISSSPSTAADGTVYFGSWDGNVYALNPDGTQKWAFTTGSYIFSSPAISPDGMVYVGSCDNYLYAINPSGTQQWRFATGGFVASSPAVGLDNVIYAGSSDNYLYAINPDGSQKWRFESDGEFVSSPAIGSDSTIYAGSTDNYLYALNSGGTQKWRFATSDWVTSSPAIGADGTIYVGSWDNYLYAINSDGSEQWRFDTGDAIESSPAIASDGTIYIGSDNGYLYAVNPDGSQQWAFDTGGGALGSTPVIDAAGTLYVGSDSGYVFALNSDGTEKWRYATGQWVDGSAAIGADGTVYIGSYDSYMYAVGPGNTDIWPTISSITPNNGGNGGTTVIANLAGTNFASDTTIQLRKTGQSSVNASDIVLVSDTQITCTFDLAGKVLGTWDVVVTNSDGRSGTLAKGFTVTDGIAPTVTINQASSQVDPSTSASVNFTAVFSEPVTGFLNSSVSVTGTAGATTVAVSDTGSHKTFNVAVSGIVQSGTVIVNIGAGVCEDAAGNQNLASTSTDNIVTVVTNVAPQVVSVSPNDGELVIDSPTTLTAVYRDGNGYTNMRWCRLLISDSSSQANAAYMLYDRLGNKLYLMNDAGTSLGAGYVPGTNVTLSNSQCEVYVKDTTVSGSGNDLTIAWSVKLKTTMEDKGLSAWMQVSDIMGAYDGWDRLGIYFMPTAPTCVSVTPSSGNVQSGTPVVFTTQLADDNGFKDVYLCYFQSSFNSSAANAVSLLYDASQKKLFLRNDANTSWGTGYAPGTDIVLQNNQCILYVKDTVVTNNGPDGLAIDWSLHLKPSQVGKRLRENLHAVDFEMLKSPSQNMGNILIQ